MNKLVNTLISQDGDVFTKWEFEKNVNWFYTEDETKKISRRQLKDFEVVCHECGCHSKIRNVTDTIQHKEFLCRKCRNSGERNSMYGKHHSEESIAKMKKANSGENNYWYGKHHSEDTKAKISRNRTGKTCGENNPMYGVNVYKYVEERDGVERVNEMKQKLSKSMTGDKNPFYGKHHTNETKETIKEKNKISVKKLWENEEYRNKVINGMLNSDKLKESRKSLEYRKKLSEILLNSYEFYASHHNEEFSKKRRKLTCEQILKCRELDGKYGLFIPNYNIKACKYFDKLMEEKNIHIQHALNGGEYCIRELGYFVDGYDKANNTVYEFDEQYHFKPNGELRDCDKIRQKEITDFLKCKFIRIRYDEIN